jgi:hypothetical protein
MIYIFFNSRHGMMADYEKIRNEIENQLKSQEKEIRNRNAFNALFAAFGSAPGALGKIFLGAEDAVDNNQHQIEQNAILKLLCEIDESITCAMNNIKDNNPRSPLVIDGLIQTYGTNTNNITGVDIANKNVEFKPGTYIQTTGKNCGNMTGLKISSSNESN